MARWGLESGALDLGMPYAEAINMAAIDEACPAALAYAIAWRETIYGQTQGWWDAATVISGDGGHGLFQLTSAWPDDWAEPPANARFAMSQFVIPAGEYWATREQGDALVKCIAATFNAGLGQAVAGHSLGDVDLYTSDHYGAAVVALYNNLIATGRPNLCIGQT